MKYMGSKARVAKHILPIILKDREEGQWYVEPFVGGANLIDKVNGLRIGNDINKYVIAVHSAIQNGWIPPDTLTEIEYKSIRRNPENYPDYIVGFAAICCSFAGKWWEGMPEDIVITEYNVTMQKNKNNTCSNSQNLC